MVEYIAAGVATLTGTGLLVMARRDTIVTLSWIFTPIGYVLIAGALFEVIMHNSQAGLATTVLAFFIAIVGAVLYCKVLGSLIP